MLLDRVSGYADEAAAYLRRRRHLRKPFARVHYPGGRSIAYSSTTDEGKALFLAAAHVIEIGGRPRPEARQARAGATPRPSEVAESGARGRLTALVAITHNPGFGSAGGVSVAATPISEEERRDEG